MFKILDVEGKKISACAVMMYKGYEISVSTVFEDNIAVFLDQDENKQEYYQDKDGNKMTNLEQAIELIESLIEPSSEVVFIQLHMLDDDLGCAGCPYCNDENKCANTQCTGGYMRVVE